MKKKKFWEKFTNFRLLKMTHNIDDKRLHNSSNKILILRKILYNIGDKDFLQFIKKIIQNTYRFSTGVSKRYFR